jgi:hypothetical protein
MEKSNNNEIVPVINNELKKNIIKEGENILEKNNFFNSLDTVMTDNNFRSFYNTYFTPLKN